MALDIKPLSITAMLSNIKSFFQSQENNSKWKDLNTGAEGNFLMRLLANIVAVISSRVVIGRREQHHETANFMSSQIALAVDNGYPVFRGLNQRRTIKILPKVTRTIPALSVIGFYGTDHSIITLEQIALVEGVETKPFKVVIGALREIQWQAKTSSLKKFVRHEQNISEDYILYLDGTPVETSKIAKDKIADKYYVYTNPYKSVTVEYLNNIPTATHKYNSDTVFTLRYVELDDVESIAFSSEMFDIGTLVNTITIEPLKPFESIEDIKHNSPVYRETQNLVRSKADWRDMYKDALPAFKEVTFRALTPSYTQVSYIKDDFTIFTKAEEALVREQVEPGRYFGRPFPDTEAPKRETTTLDVMVGLVDEYIEEEDVKTDVQSIIDGMYDSKFNQKLNVYDIEEQIKTLSYVKYARVSLHIPERIQFNTYVLGDMIQETTTYEDINGNQVEETNNYKCTAILGRAGTTEPSWFAGVDIVIPEDDIKVKLISTETGEEVDGIRDNELEWQCYKRLPSMTLTKWSANSLYAVGDFIYTDTLPGYMFKCSNLISFTANTAPSTDNIEVGDFMIDGMLQLVCVEYNAEDQDRVSSYSYRLGNRYKLNSKSFEVIGYVGAAAGTSTLHFTDSIKQLYVLPVEARAALPAGDLYLDGDFREDIRPGDTLQVSMAYEKETSYEEVSETNLTRTAVINAKVKEYEDDDTDKGTTTVINTTATNTTVNIDMSNSVYVMTGQSSPEDEPNLNGKEIGETVPDYELTLELIAYDDSLPIRVAGQSYHVGDQFRLADVTTAALEVIAINNGSSAPSGTTSDTSTETSQSTVVIPPDDPVVQNANWKELEEVKAQMEQIQKWIDSEESDTLKTPADVIAFYRSLGDGSRFTPDELTRLEKYYVEYNAYDEEQIFLHMDQFGTTRDVAIEELSDVGQLSAPISNAKCIKLLDTDGNVVYVDRYGSATYDDTTKKLVFSENYVPCSTTYAIRREKENNEPVKITSHISGRDDTVQYEKIKVPYVKLFTITVEDRDYDNFPIANPETGEVNKYLTWIQPTAPVDYYNDGSYINLSYNTTTDGRLQWTVMDDVENIKYGWNIYPNIDVNVKIKS